ncbi:MAG: hypothetical protein ACTHOE_13570 [Conexibacter sp.]
MASHARSRGRAGVAEPVAQQTRERPLAVRADRIVERLSAHQHRTAAGLFALLVLVLLWPVLVGGGMLAPTSVLFTMPPWAALAPSDLAHFYNQGLGDVPLSYYPWDVLARQLIHAGTFPAWNPHALAGTPFFANPEVAWLSPFSLPLWVLPLNYGLGVAAAIKLWLAGFGTYLLVRELRLGFWPGILAGVAFALCAFNVVWLSYQVFLSTAALLPWMLWLVERIARRGRPVHGLVLAGITAVALTGGHPGTEVHVLAATVLYALMRVLASRELDAGERLRRLGLVGAALALAAMAAAVVLLPAQQAAVGTAGAAARHGGGTEHFNGAHMPIGVLRTLLLPDWWGRPSEVILGPAPYNERTFYAGTIALLLAVVALVRRGSAWRAMAPFAALGALGVAIALEAPGLHWLVVHLPGFAQVQNQRIVLWLLLAIAVLAAFGLERLLEEPRRQQAGWWVAGGGALAVLLALGSIDLGGDTLRRGFDYVIHRAPPITPNALALASVMWLAVFVGIFAGLLLLARRHPERRVLIGGLVALAAALDMLHFAHGYNPMAPASKAIPPRTAAISFLQRHSDEGRIAGLDFAVANDWSTVYGLRDVRGYDAPQPSLRFHRLWRALEPQQGLHTSYMLSSVEPTSLRVLGMLGARWIAAEPGVHFELRALTPVYRGRDATVFENALAMPRAIVASRVHVADDEDGELAATVADGFDPRRDAVVRRDELGAGAAPIGAGSVRVVGEANSRVTLRATLARRSVVVLDDAWAPGWSVKVDGRPSRPLQADMVLRGVVVPAGTHEIAWSYRVPGLRAGAALSALALLIAAGWGAWLLARRRRGAGRRFPLARGRPRQAC